MPQTVNKDLSPLLRFRPGCDDRLPDAREIADLPILRDWYDRVSATAQVHTITIDHVARVPESGRILFLKTSPEIQPHQPDGSPGERLLWNVFITGPSSSICAVFNHSAAAEDHYVLMARQYRPGLGRSTLEIPGGLQIRGADLQNSALRELSEETGVTLRATDLHPFVSGPDASSPSTVTEVKTLYFAFKAVSSQVFERLSSTIATHREQEQNSFGVSSVLMPLTQAVEAVRGDLKSVFAVTQACGMLGRAAVQQGDWGRADAFLACAFPAAR